MQQAIESPLREAFYKEVVAALSCARARAYRATNLAMVEAYWEVGRLIVVEEQRGEARAVYAAFLLPRLAVRLTPEYGRGCAESNLKYFRLFYLAFPGARVAEIRHTLCDGLTWSHYRALTRVSNAEARSWYMQEAAAQGWAVRTLERQINSFAFERTLRTVTRMEKPPQPKRVAAATLDPRDFIKDPYVLEFLDLGDRPELRETTRCEQADAACAAQGDCLEVALRKLLTASARCQNR